MKKLTYTQIMTILSVLFFCLSCSSVYYGAWEKLGYQKRDLLKSSVSAAQNQQKEANQQFKDALQQLRLSYNIKSTELESKYNKLQKAYDNSVNESDSLKSRISKMDRIANDLFYEWKQEADSITSSSMQQTSLSQLQETKEKYKTMYAALLQSQKNTEPVLAKFRDYVLFLKHNLNAQSIGALQGEASNIASGLERLISDMNLSIGEADQFINTLNKS
jgi:chromosome segregation ATPase